MLQIDRDRTRRQKFWSRCPIREIIGATETARQNQTTDLIGEVRSSEDSSSENRGLGTPELPADPH